MLDETNSRWYQTDTPNKQELTATGVPVANESPILPSTPAQQWTNTGSETAEYNHSVDTEHLSDLITTVADRLVPVIDDLPDRFDEHLNAWCVSHGLTDATRSDKQQIIARQAVFNWLLKVTVYEWYHRCGELPALPGDTFETLEHVIEATANDGCNGSMLDHLVPYVDEPGLEIIQDHRDRLLASTRPAEDIGRLYESLVPAAQRKVLGQFRTPPHLARVLRGWAVTDGDTVLDPGMGPAVLTSRQFPGWVFREEPDQIIGVERSPLAALMGTVALTLSGQDHAVRGTDFFDLDDSDVADDVDAIVANPPFTAYNDLPESYRADLNAQTARRIDRDIPKKTPLHAYFLYHAGELLAPGDRMAVVIPHHILDRQYGTIFKQYVLEEFRVHAAVLIDPASDSVFETADSTALLLFLEAADHRDPSGVTKLIEVTDPTHEAWYQAVPDVATRDTEWGRVTRVGQDQLQARDNWFRNTMSYPVGTSNLAPLFDIADVHRGVSTCDNAFFCLSQREVDAFGIDEQYLRPLIRTVSKIDGSEYTNEDWRAQRRNGDDVWLLDITDLPSVPDDLSQAKATRTEWGKPAEPTRETASVADGVRAYLSEYVSDITSPTLEERSCWYRTERAEPADIVVQNYARSEFNVVLNDTDAVNLNNGNSIHVDESLTRDETKVLAAFLNSSVGNTLLHHHAETKTGGSYRLTPGMLSDVGVVDPRTLDPPLFRYSLHCTTTSQTQEKRT